MASTSSGPDTEATHVMGNEDGSDNYINGMIGDTEDKARWHAREALKYARMASPRTGVTNRNPNHTTQAQSLDAMIVAQDDRIGRTEVSLAATRIVDQFRSEFLDGWLRNEEENAVARAVVSGLVAYAPIVTLGSSTQEGKPFMSGTKVWSLGAIAAVTLADAFRGRIAKVLKDLNENGESAAVDEAKDSNATPAETGDGTRLVVEKLNEVIEAIKTSTPAREPSP